ncbi:Transcriptional activator ARO80 [Trichoderma lentiforme]|uniref:Transcriptional activator ARO80 n=1 Tax=Trichoderma lentiforme TaxID=1567552 RepID=A0A9P5CAB8_9HYPO|nr:Transcriptional activator ARO80 [Trichoderma lentiforme]
MAQYASTASPAQSTATTASAQQQPTAASAGQSQSGQSQVPQHKRVYQACIPCRRRKVRCDLGSVDNPHDPPCVRCRRESKECFFSATRRKRKTDEDDSDADEYVVRNGRKKLHAADSPPFSRFDKRQYSDTPLTPGGSHGRTQPLRRPDGKAGVRGHDDGEFDGDGDSNQTLENLEAQTVMRRGVYGPHDALDLLYKAATDRFVMPSSAAAYGTANRESSPAADTHRRQPSMASIAPGPPQQAQATDEPGLRARSRGPSISVRPEQSIDPNLSRPTLRAQPGYEDALRAWSRFRFVRAGWFTAQEAIEYIDYYYKYLSPLTPISPPTFSNPSSHLTLLTEEPILTVTLLTISSRYCQLPGTGGICRSHAVPEQLWTYLRGMIERCLWGQEAFGGGFCGSGSASTSMITEESQTSSTAPWRGLRKGSLRTLGTIESLLILTEWHPRALHFPPQEATDELVLPIAEASPLMASEDELHRTMGPGIGGKRIESWLEPAWRSDRMCWMLLSTAMGLAYELGVFDDIDELLKDDAITRPEYKDEVYRQRANRIKRLLLIYTSQLAGRLGWTSMTPEHLRKADPAVARQRPLTNDSSTPATNPSSLANGFNYVPDLELDDQIIHCWAGISNAMHLGNEKLFKTRKHTTEIIQSGKYVDLLRDFTPLLKDWYREFELFRLPQYIRHILTIEYEYVRIYINSLSLQAVVERCTNNAGNASSSGNGVQPTHLSPQTMINYGKLPLGQLGGFTVHDQEYVREVVEGSRNLLRTVVEGLLPGGYLKHAPVRTYFRIISGAMFLLKTFALGAPRSDVKLSIELMDATVEALRNCIVDDVHLGIRFADLLESLTSRLRNRFIQAPMQQPSAKAQSPVPEAGNAGAVQPVQNGETGENGAAWVGSHAQRLRDGLNGHYRVPTPTANNTTTEANNISATPFDLSTGNFPYHGASSIGPSTPAADNSNASGAGNMDVNLFDEWNNAGSEMWYLPPGPAFFQNMENSSVAMTAEGVNVGGLDLLEYMAMDPVQFPGLDGPGTSGAAS